MLLAQPQSCSALIGTLSSLDEFCEPLISKSMQTSFASVKKFASYIKIGFILSSPVKGLFWSWSELLASFSEADKSLFGLALQLFCGDVSKTFLCAFDRGWAHFSFPTSGVQQHHSLNWSPYLLPLALHPPLGHNHYPTNIVYLLLLLWTFVIFDEVWIMSQFFEVAINLHWSWKFLSLACLFANQPFLYWFASF